jgi:integrase
MQRAGLGETAARAANFAESVFRRAIATDRCKVNPALSSHFRGQLKTPKTKNRPALTDPARVGELMDWLETPSRGERMSNYPSVRNALRLCAHTWLRSEELRGGRWEELRGLDGDKPEWVVPAGRMKMDRPHIVPLSRQAVAIIKEQRELVDALGGSPLMFPGARGLSSRPITGDALMHALHTLWKDEHSVHGFRSTASTLLNEAGYDSALVELQLAHKGADKIQKIYDRSQRLDDRRVMMQFYSDMLDRLRAEHAPKT